MLQAWQHPLHHHLGILGVGGGVVDHAVQDEHLRAGDEQQLGWGAVGKEWGRAGLKKTEKERAGGSLEVCSTRIAGAVFRPCLSKARLRPHSCPHRTWPHSVHSLRARSRDCTVAVVSCSTGLPLSSWISLRAATALATTMGLASRIRSCRGGGVGCAGRKGPIRLAVSRAAALARTASITDPKLPTKPSTACHNKPATHGRLTLSMSRKPRSSTSSALMSNSLATHTAAVLRTYGSSSCTGGSGWEVVCRRNIL